MRARILRAAVFMAGLALFLLPFVAGRVADSVSADAAQAYLASNDCNPDPAYEAALAWNARLASEPDQRSMSPGRAAEYMSLLDPGGDGVMAVLEIPSIGVLVPVVHGTSAAVLSACAGHDMHSSLPVGGASSHCVIAGHSGVPGHEPFVRLSELTVGDMFRIHVQKRVLEYLVDRIDIVDPDDVDALAIVEGEDRVTLITCVPYGINSHRLLVSGTRAS